MSPHPEPPSRVVRLVELTLFGATASTMLAWTWRTWPDPIVDFGRELYMPWRLAEGAVLFRDVASFTGPFSPHGNAALFALFGPSLTTLVAANLVLLGVLAILVHRLLVEIADRPAATVGVVVLLTTFAFGRTTSIGNYNWVTPYAHALTHGILLALGAVVLLRRPGVRAVAGAGVACGLAFLTKPETFVAALAGSAPLLCLRVARGPGPATLAAFLGGLVAAVVVAIGWLARDLPLDEAFRGVLGSWPLILAGRVADLPFYRAGMGLDEPFSRLTDVGVVGLTWGLVLAPSVLLAFAAPRFLGRLAPASVPGVIATLGAAVIATLVAVAIGAPALEGLRALRPLPFVVAAIGLAVLVGPARRSPRGVLVLSLVGLSLALLGKMALHARIVSYGFALALPGTTLAVAALVAWIPRWLDRHGASGIVFRAGSLTAIAAFVVEHLLVTASGVALQTEPVGSGADRFLADARGRHLERAREIIERIPARTLAVLPEGAMLNVLTRRPNPTPYVNFMPPQALTFGEDAWLEAFRAAPPDVVALVHKDTTEYGFPLFGRDYGRALVAWIEARYRTLVVIGEEPLVPGTRFGIRILVRRDRPVTPPSRTSRPSSPSGR